MGDSLILLAYLWLMSLLRLIFLLSIFLPGPLFSQAKLASVKENPEVVSVEALYRKYLSDEIVPDSGIAQLMKIARQGDMYRALRILQLAFLVEKKATKLSNVTFELNIYMGELVSLIDKRYALSFYDKAVAHIGKADGLHPYRIYHLYTNKAGVHQYLGETDSARHYYQVKALKAAPPLGYVANAAANNNVGYFYILNDQFERALPFHQTALDILGEPNNDIDLFTAIMNNLARIDMEMNRYDEAIARYIVNDSIHVTLRRYENLTKNRVRLLGALQKRDPDDVRIHQYIQDLKTYVDSFKDQIEENNLLSYYAFANDYYFRIGDRENENIFRNRQHQLKEKIDKKNLDQYNYLTQTLLTIQKEGLHSEIKSQKLIAEASMLKLKSARFTSIAAVTIGTLIILLLGLYIRKRKLENDAARKIATAELSNKELQASLLEKDLLLKKRDLTNIVLHNTQVYDAHQKIIGRLEEITNQKNQEPHVRSLLVELQTQNQISDRSINLQSNIETVNEEFYEKLKATFPNLTKAESELCGYIRINLSNKDISVLKNVEANSVKRTKTRLRKKLGITPEEDLYAFMREV